MDPASLTDDELARAVATIEGEALADLLHAIDTAEILNRDKIIHMGAAALWYAQTLHWPVLPIVARGKRPLTSRGFKDASTDPDQIRSWWTRWPDANIGTPTGADGCGLDVIDVDGRTGHASLARLKHAHCPPDCTAVTFCPALGEIPPPVCTALTPGSTDGTGRHLYVAASGDGNATAYAPGMDYRGDGGYVVLPPSLGMNGVRYSWATPPEVPA